MVDAQYIRKLYERYPEMVTKGDVDGIVALYAPDATIDLSSLITEELSAQASVIDGQVSVGGPRLALSGKAAETLSLALHELATNAAKYGALCSPYGRLHVDWSLDGARLSVIWTERNGPAIDKPFEPGFGARLVSRLIKSHGGEIVPEFRPEGLCVRISVLLPAESPDRSVAGPAQHAMARWL